MSALTYFRHGLQVACNEALEQADTKEAAKAAMATMLRNYYGRCSRDAGLAIELANDIIEKDGKNGNQKAS